MNTFSALRKLEAQFLSAKRVTPADLAADLSVVQSLGGAYGLWKGDTLRYFGETCHLNHRLLEIVALGRHHSLNLLLGDRAKAMSGRDKAAWIRRSSFVVSWLPIDFGRAEFEEFMVLKYSSSLLNHQSRRFSLRSDIELWRKLIE